MKYQRKDIQFHMEIPEIPMYILNQLKNTGYETYFCGGCIRDYLLNKNVKDYDIATSATPEQIEKIFPKTLTIGKAFGVTIVVYQEKPYEIATFRNDLGYSDGRRPDSIVFSNAREDAMRRDFTINALFYDPEKKHIIDFVDGYEDLKNKILKSVGAPEKRFQEDHLRLLRAIRFAARTDFKIEENTWQAITKLKDKIELISPERIAQELEGMLINGYAYRSFKLLEESGLLNIILPELALTKNVCQPQTYHPEGDVWTHTLFLLKELDLGFNNQITQVPQMPLAYQKELLEKNMDTPNLSVNDYSSKIAQTWQEISANDLHTSIAWAGLLHDVAKPQTQVFSDRIRFSGHDILGADLAVTILERLKRNNKLINNTYNLIKRHINFSTLKIMRKSKLRRWLRESDFSAHLELHRADCASSHASLGNWNFGFDSWQTEQQTPQPLAPLLTGHDLLALGIKPGPLLGQLIKDIEDLRLEDIITDKNSALEYARNKIIPSA